jgi:hypothetical protein
MPAKQVGAVYLVDCKCFNAAVLRKYRDTLQNNEKKSKVVKVKVLGLLPGSRSYECVVVGTADKVKLLSKSLGQLHAARAHEAPPQHICYSSDDNLGPGEGEGSESSNQDASEVGAADAANGNLA